VPWIPNPRKNNVCLKVRLGSSFEDHAFGELVEFGW
jgi:hypothetical protein